MSGTEFVIFVLVVLVASGLFYFIKAWRTCYSCGKFDLWKTGRDRLYEGYREQYEYKCSYCGSQEWKDRIIPGLSLSGHSRKHFEKQANAWRQISNEIGAEFIEEPDETCKVRARVKNWTITLYTTTEDIGLGYSMCTDMRAAYANKDGFEFTIRDIGFFDLVGKPFGAQHVKLEDPDLDREYIIKTNDKAKARALFANRRIRQLIHAQRFTGFAARYHEGFHELYYRIEEIRIGESTERIPASCTTDVKRLKDLFELFTETLNQLIVIGSASEEDPNVVL